MGTKIKEIAFVYEKEDVVSGPDALYTIAEEVWVKEPGKKLRTLAFSNPSSISNLADARRALRERGWVRADSRKDGEEVWERWLYLPFPEGFSYPAVRYSKIFRRWEVITAGGDVYPAKDREDAEWIAVQVANPDLAALAAGLAEKYPHLDSRVRRAARLVVEGAVQRNGSDHTFDITRHTRRHGTRVYRVGVGGNWPCVIADDTSNPSVVGTPCPDVGAPLVNGIPRCKHRIAAWFYAKTNGNGNGYTAHGNGHNGSNGNGNGSRRPAAARYGDGGLVSAADLPAFAEYVRARRRPPTTRNDLLAWARLAGRKAA